MKPLKPKRSGRTTQLSGWGVSCTKHRGHAVHWNDVKENNYSETSQPKTMSTEAIQPNQLACKTSEVKQ